ncbi:MAG TPA: epoxyqueuosine reductase [Lachnospiraceae bacterium]|nr:epoxyqueuosine reductase [Lachnospiraceae bacterium]
MTLEMELYEIVSTIIKNHPKASYYREPVIGYADAEDPLYDQLDEIIGNPQLHPRDMLTGAKTVMVLFLPYSEIVYNSIGRQHLVSSVWSDAYMETNKLLDHIMNVVSEFLSSRGIRSSCEPPTENFDHVSKTARWGHKSNAVIAGIGSFGLNHLLITKKGCMGRMNSLVMDAHIPPTPRTGHEYCLYYQNGGCKACIKNCPSGAIWTDGTIDKKRCDAYLEGKNIHDWQQGCPQCSLGPCALKGF